MFCLNDFIDGVTPACYIFIHRSRPPSQCRHPREILYIIHIPGRGCLQGHPSLGNIYVIPCPCALHSPYPGDGYDDYRKTYLCAIRYIKSALPPSKTDPQGGPFSLLAIMLIPWVSPVHGTCSWSSHLRAPAMVQLKKATTGMNLQYVHDNTFRGLVCAHPH